VQSARPLDKESAMVYNEQCGRRGFGQHGMPPTASNPDLWPFDLETGMWDASKVGTFLQNWALCILELFAMYATDRQTNRQQQRLFLPSRQSEA